MKFDYKSSEGKPVCAISLSHLWGDTYSVLRHRESEEAISTDIWSSLLGQALQYAQSIKGKNLCFRLIDDQDAINLSHSLSHLGFIKKNERVEYRLDVALLPNAEGSSLLWKKFDELQWSKEKLAQFFMQVSQGDPDFDPNEEDPMECLESWLSDPELSCGPQCVHIGFWQNRPCALVVAQVHVKSGWSRITYMGLIPEVRNQGLGVWVHRQGFKMIREQGGKLYHGGTDATNHSMIKLFEKHQCQFYRRMSEWGKNLST